MADPVELKKIVVGALQTNAYVLIDPQTHQALLIDPGAEAAAIQEAIQQAAVQVSAIVLTHGHYDHIGAVEAFAVPLYVHAADAAALRDAEKNLSALFAEPRQLAADIQTVENGDEIPFGTQRVRVLHTPGHSPGGICLLVGDILISGDTLFCEGIGRTDLPGGCAEQLEQSIQKQLFSLAPQTRVYPGHGPQTTIKAEQQRRCAW